MSYVDDNAQSGIKVFREHTADIDPESKSNKIGALITDQSNDTGQYTLALPGDEAGWLFCTNSETRDIGSWSQAVPAILTESGIIPIFNKALAIDTNYAYKTEATSGNDETKIRVAEETEVGTPGIIVQCLNQASHEQIFFPLGAGNIKVDWLSAGNESTKIYGVAVDGTTDLANVGTTKDFLYVDTSFVYVHTDTKFRYDNTLKGRLDFANSSIPTAGAGETLYNVRPYFDSGSGLWKWYIVVTDGTGIVADNTNVVDSSTYIYGAAVGGGADPGNKGSCKEIFYIDDNIPYIQTTAKFRQDNTNKGVLDFQSAAPPTPAAGQTLYQPTLHFSGGKWQWYVAVDDAGGGVFCRVAWNYSSEGDFSEGETVTYNATTDAWTGTGTKIWVDWEKSKAVKFETAGTFTIFEAKILKPNHVRKNQTRDLYRLISCVEDGGFCITHIEKIDIAEGLISGYVLSNDDVLLPWIGADGNRIVTTIDVAEIPNIIQTRIPKEWDTGVGNWKFVEIADISKALPWYAIPVRPIMEDPETSMYNSYYSDGQDITIATYKRVGV
uniref:Uncharacterized protein n=1 Tax=viral metagenome TaxID=1070528 RepID=A0A6H1ZGI7_9ZZZZ